MTSKSALTLLIITARSEGKWLYARYHDLWLSPDELEREMKRGNFLWEMGAFERRDPKEALDLIDAKIAMLKKERADFVARMEEAAHTPDSPVRNIPQEGANL